MQLLEAVAYPALVQLQHDIIFADIRVMENIMHMCTANNSN